MPTIIHANWPNRLRTAFRRWTQAVHHVAAIQAGRHRFLACPYHLLAAKRQAKAGLSSGHSHDRIAFESFAPNVQTSSTHATMAANVSASYQHTQHVVVTRTHARTYNARQRDKSPDSPATPSRTGGEINVVLQQQRMVRVWLPLGQLGLESSVT